MFMPILYNHNIQYQTHGRKKNRRVSAKLFVSIKKQNHCESCFVCLTNKTRDNLSDSGELTKKRQKTNKSEYIISQQCIFSV